MSENTNEKPFAIEKAKTGRAACKKCKQKCDANQLRIAKLVTNFFSDSGMMKHWYHVDCLFESFKTQRSTTTRIESVDDIEGWDTLTEAERDTILEKLQETNIILSPRKKEKKTNVQPQPSTSTAKTSITTRFRKDSDDNLFSVFRGICERLAATRGYSMKSQILQNFLIMGSYGNFEGDVYLWIKMLLPSAIKRIYNLQSKQLVKLFSRVFRTRQQDMLIDLEQGDVSETIRKFFESSSTIQPKTCNTLTMQEVDQFLDNLSFISKEDDQVESFQQFCKNCNADDLKLVIRLIKHDLRINSGPRHILDALHPAAYSAFQSSRDLKMVVDKFAPLITENKITSADISTEKTKGAGSSGGVQLMSPISPMLAEACKSVEKAILKNPEGMYSEIKYDGERVQIHKRGNEFKFFSRNLKPVPDHKINRCKEFIPKAFPSGNDMILDSEILVVNTITGELLPFGTLGVHKREQFTSSEVCLFIFDCIYYNGEDLTKKPLLERKKILKDNIKPIKNHVQLSEYYHLKTQKELAVMTAKVLKAGLEGLVLKNIKSSYQPGKRGWLKIKKDYLFEGQMADTADLVVLGAWFGTGKKGGMLSIFLMGCLDSSSGLWKTVTKVHSGLDDSTMDDLQDTLKKLMTRANSEKPPTWISCKKQLIPDYIAIDPSKMPVWEITGAEFTKAEAHTANGISIRFPRITKIRDDKDTKDATNLNELETLFKNSKDAINVDMLFKGLDEIEGDVDIKTKFFDPNKSLETKSSDSDEKEEDSPKSTKRTSNQMIKSEEESPFKEMKKIKLEKEKNSLKESSKEMKQRCDFKEHIDVRDIVEKKLSGIFDGVVAFVPPEVEESFESSLKVFLKWGGHTMNDTQSATHIFHLHNRISEDYETLRRKYQPTCRHLTYKWIEDSIINKKLMPIPEYAVLL